MSPRPDRKKPREPLSRGGIARAALQLIDAEGLEQLSMRRLGAHLGVEAMALYHHFPSKAELLDGVLDCLLDETDPALDGDDAPLLRLRRCFDALRGVAIHHPRAFWVLASRRFRTERSLAFYERLLQAFADAGFDAQHTARYFRLLAGFVVGAGIAEVGSRAMQGAATPILLERYADPERHPRITEVVPHLRVARLDDIFSFGLDTLFAAMEKDLRRMRR
ncbi:TetR/AcrR family transcriptional regulator [Fontimonas sp. SYSU GA230001]|uniref:TetR/AcrR family transcriptional regulator n=1 Tax=Fontimonas sp. SYSU GA230001 TaxID=3142450 RepID=UPI0032B32154